MRLIKDIEVEVTGGTLEWNQDADLSKPATDVVHTKQGYIHLETYEVKNDIEIDFMCVAEECLSYDLETFMEVLTKEGVHAAWNWLDTTRPITKTLVKEHVYDNPMKCELDYMDELEVFECIQAL